MSEELIKRKLDKSGKKALNFEYFEIGETTLNQLKNAKIIPIKNYGKYNSKKPDCLLVNKQNKKIPDVIVSLEYKKPSDFKTDNQKLSAIRQCNTVAQEINAKIGVITDGQIYFWINPNQKIKENTYPDEVTGQKRSYAHIRNEDKKDLTEKFIINENKNNEYDKLDDDTKNTIDYINRILENVSENNSTLKSIQEVDPLPLAKSVWQDIYINTGKDPTKCLYNVVELFIFKFLSDLKVLKNEHSFQHLIDLTANGSQDKDILEYYARNSRLKIRELFPKSEKDNTTIINGTIFVDSSGKPVTSQAHLFVNSIKKYNQFGSLKHIKKEFKTKLFEIFLKQSKDKSRLGQFFTPRKVVRAIVEMSDVEKLKKGANFCDPFCGVGGFICEALQNTKRKIDFIPKNGKILPQINYSGFDKGSDDEEERTIILAKANMLIYLSEIIEKNPTLTDEFAKIFNNIFTLLTDSNLGTLKIKNKEEDKYDLILTNPPYISGGVKSIKDEIIAEGLENEYTENGKGVEGLALEWIVKNLNKEGKAFVIVPHSIFNVSQNQKLRQFILKQCFLDGIISLPSKTFFNTPQKTYILIITKKQNNEKQLNPVFTYLVNNIGETLDINRFEIEGKSDLEKAKDLFNAFKGSPQTFPIKEIGDKRCKISEINYFESNKNWIIENLWTKEEKIELGIEEEIEEIDIDEFQNRLKEAQEEISQQIQNISQIKSKKKIELKSQKIGILFDFPTTNSKITKEFCNNNKGDIPVYASSKSEDSVLGHIKDNLKGVHYYSDCLSWNRNGSVGYVFIRKGKFATNEDHRAMILKPQYKKFLDKSYLKIEIEKRLLEEGFSFLDKCGVEKIKEVDISIPFNGKNFDIDLQNELYKQSKTIVEAKQQLNKIKNQIEKSEFKFSDIVNVKEMPLIELFKPEKGNAEYTKDYIRKNIGDYPVYSSQTTNEGVIGKIKTFDFDTNCLTWTTDGVYAGTVFLRNGKFSMTTHCGALIPRENWKNKIDLNYMYFELNKRLKEEAVGDINKRVTISNINTINVEIPINKNGVDLEQQKILAKKYSELNQIKLQFVNKLNNLTDSFVSVI
jgi:type I restriction enzyme M protein